MLQELSIQNFAIIQKLNISFQPGMTVLTGETGAGKSIIIDAVGLLTGGRGSQDYIREGADKAVIQGLLDLQPSTDLQALLQEHSIPLDDQQLLIHRELHRTGRNVIRVNGTLVNASLLKQIGHYLVDIYGQNEQQELMQVDQHIRLLDQYGAKKIRPVLTAYQQAYQDYQQLTQTLKKHLADEHAWAQRLDMLTFQVNELQAADLQPDEEEHLTAEYQELSNFQDVLEGLSKAHEVLDGDWEPNGSQSIGTALAALEGIEDLSPKYGHLAENMREVYYNLQDVSSDILSVKDSLAFDPERLREVESRLDLIRGLEQKYGATVAEVLAHQAKVEAELDAMSGENQSVEGLKEKVEGAKKRSEELANQLHKKRQVAAKELTNQIHEQLRDLYMAKAEFSVIIKPTENLQLTGSDQVEFYIKTNEGERAKPLVKIASGGELSRMMLAIKTIFSQEQGTTAIIFDEVDTGVSGRVAQAIAEKIADIGQHSQVLTITHLPQVAALADHHFFIQKKVDAGRTQTVVTTLDETGRIDELARMLSGDKLTAAAKENARTLLASGQDK